MLRTTCIALIPFALAIALASCDDNTGPSEERFVIPLGPEGVTTDASGTATFRVPETGPVAFTVQVNNLNNFTMTHIHRSSDGAVVVWLRPEGPPPQLVPGVSNGVIAEGTFDETRLVGPLQGQSLDVLLTLMRTGAAYVNVHTQQNPGGEIRGDFPASQ